MMNLGIDLGTTNTMLAYTDQYNDIKVYNFEHDQTNGLPTLVCIHKSKIYVGSTAIIYAQSDVNAILHRNFKTHSGTNDILFIDENKVNWNSEGMMNTIIEFIFKVVGDKLGAKYIDNLTITVPIHFNDTQRKYTSHIAESGLVTKVNIIDEPVAAAYYYIGKKMIMENEIVLIYDFGGGTFDCTLMTYSGDKMDILSKFGHNRLGGRNIDAVLLSHFADILSDHLGSFETWNNIVLQEVHQLIREFKESIGSSTNTIMEYTGLVKGTPIRLSLTTTHFENLITPIIDQTIEIVKQCIESAHLTSKSLNKIILTGGSSHINLIPTYLSEILSIPKGNILSENLTEAVAIGACMYSCKDELATKNKNDIPSEYASVSHFNLGVLSLDPITNQPVVDLLIPKNAKLPFKAFQKYFTSSDRQSKLIIYLVQYMDNKDDYQVIGSVTFDEISTLKEKYETQLSIEYKNDGMISCSVFDVQTGITKNINIKRLDEADAALIQQRNAIKNYQIIG